MVGSAAILVLLTVLRLAHPLVRTDDAVSPMAALDHVPSEILRQPVFNDYHFGGYLIFRNVKPFIDGRADMYGDDFNLAYISAMMPNRAAFEQMVERYGFRWTILCTESPALAMLDALPGWRRLYTDGMAVVHVRTGDGQ
jgi:hypothetical protein